MSVPITKKKLVDWAGAEVVRDAEALVKQGLVLEATYKPPMISGSVLWNNRALKTSLEVLEDGNVENGCPCYASKERGIVCSHVTALALTIVLRSTDPRREEKYQEEQRRAARVAKIDESSYIQRVPAGTPGAMPATLQVTFQSGWQNGFQEEKTPIIIEVTYRKETIPLDEVSPKVPLTFSRQDENLLTVLEDISEGPARGFLELNRFDLANVIYLHSGRALSCADGRSLTVNQTRMSTRVRIDLDHETGELILMAHTELPFMKPGAFPSYILSGKSSWVYGANHLWPLENVLPEPYHGLYREPIVVARPHVLRFLQQELSLLETQAVIESDLSLELFTIEPASPRFRLEVKGSPAALSAVLYAQYDNIELVAGKPDAKEQFGIPDPNDLMCYTVRNPDAEKAALIRLAPSGLRGETGDPLTSIVGSREVLNFIGTHLPSLRRKGWTIDLHGKISPYLDSMDFITPVVHVNDQEDGHWFDISFDFEDREGTSLAHADIQVAIQKGDSFVKQGNRILLFDVDAIESMQDVFSDCASEESDKAGHFRLSGIFAGFVKSSLDALDGIDVETTPEWQSRAGHINRTLTLEPVQLPESLDHVLRPYQKEGVNWLRFLEGQGLCGLLADEMGLGKTLEALAWLQLERCDPQSKGKPALIVCPTSLVDNWVEEAHRFVPDLKSLAMTGSDRHEKWTDLTSVDMVITSYAILRRDLDQYLEHDFSVMILDEAQHIKNRSTQNAVCAKQVKARHRLVLTGTPVENSVADLWSIMDFLMPGYLGRHDSFRQCYELPISRGGQEGERAQSKLRRKLHPFLLRRLKTSVAPDLPKKIENISYCTLTGDQQMVYNEILKTSRKKISSMVSQKGFNKCRMEILTTLMRLRQICCHLDLLKLPDLNPRFPSAKLDLFFELLDEAIDGRHRILVFSQFVSMLKILRTELEKRDLSYCYLDGATEHRLAEVKKFNTQRDLPVFLISLKAGGPGLNLTGADMVVQFDPWWNPTVEDQATDRAHRIGQKRTVYSVKLISKGTIEEKVLSMQKKKKAVIDATIESDEKMIQSLSWDDVQELLNL